MSGCGDGASMDGLKRAEYGRAGGRYWRARRGRGKDGRAGEAIGMERNRGAGGRYWKGRNG